MHITHAIISNETTNIMNIDFPKWSLEIFPKKIFVGTDAKGQPVNFDGFNYVLTIRDTLGVHNRGKRFKDIFKLIPTGALGSLETFSGPMADSKKYDPVMITYTWDDIRESEKWALRICRITATAEEIIDGFKTVVWPHSQKIIASYRERFCS